MASGDFDAALSLFAQALASHPHHLQILLDAARAFGSRYQLDYADELLQKFLSLAPDTLETYLAAGDVYRSVEMRSEAVTCFEKAVARGVSPLALIELGNLYERQRRTDQAFECIHRALALEPNAPSARLILARIERQRGNTADAETLLRCLPRDPIATPELIAEAWGELGLLLDERGDYDGAWVAIQEAKALALPYDNAERTTAEHVLNRFAVLADDLTPEHFLRWKLEARPAPIRTALLTGFPRTGTTLLERVLDSHPEVISVEERPVLGNEVLPALGKGFTPQYPALSLLDNLSPETIDRERERYQRCMEGFLREPVGNRVLLDKNPASGPLIPLLFRLFPDSTVLLALRDPRDVVLSCYLRYLPLNPVSVSFLTPERTAMRYALDMLIWLKLREIIPAQWAEIRYEDSVADLPAAARRALTAMHLPWDEQVLGYREQLKDRFVLTPTYVDVARPVHQRAIGRWRNYARYLESVLPILEPYVEEFGYERA